MGFLVDFDSYKRNTKYYGGDAGAKYGLTGDGCDWMVKFPKNTAGLAKAAVSYTTSPLSEYVGSHVYELLGIPVHQTVLGVRSGKVVVGCRDFCAPTDQLIEFKKIKNSLVDEEPSPSPSPGSPVSSGRGTDLAEVLYTISASEDLRSVPGVERRFWDMFVVDALIGNNDRNNNNWGLLRHIDGSLSLAPVYDNGNSFFNKCSDAAMAARLDNRKLLEQDAFGTYRSTYLIPGTGHHIDAFALIDDPADYPGLAEARERVSSHLDMVAIDAVIDAIPEEEDGHAIMGPSQRELYRTLLQMRAERISRKGL